MKKDILTKFKHKKKIFLKKKKKEARCGSRRNIETLYELVEMSFGRLKPICY